MPVSRQWHRAPVGGSLSSAGSPSTTRSAILSARATSSVAAARAWAPASLIATRSGLGGARERRCLSGHLAVGTQGRGTVVATRAAGTRSNGMS